MVVHDDECHFNLIVPMDCRLATEGGLDFQRSEKVRLRNEEMLNARSAQEDINKDAYIEMLKKELNTVKSENHKLVRELKELKLDVSGTK